MLYTDWGSFRNWYTESRVCKVLVERGYKYEKREMSDPMQHTGLLDKNGTEIYEGDIIQGVYNSWDLKWEGNYSNPINKESEQVIFKVTSDKGCFKMEGFQSIYFHELYSRDDKLWDSRDYVHNNNYGATKHCNKYTEFEVIGNICENPELLESD